MFLKYKRESFDKMILFRIFAAAATAATAAVAETVPPAEPVLPDAVEIEPVVTELEEVATIEESIGYFQYIMQNMELEVYVGKLDKEIKLVEEVNKLYWIDKNENFFDVDKYAGEGNIGHMLRQVETNKNKLFS